MPHTLSPFRLRKKATSEAPGPPLTRAAPRTESGNYWPSESDVTLQGIPARVQPHYGARDHDCRARRDFRTSDHDPLRAEEVLPVRECRDHV